MKVLRDENKRLTNLAKHGMDFADLNSAFFDRAVTRSSVSGRSLAIGIVKGCTIATVVYRRLGTEAVSVISMRRASRNERKLL